MLFKNILNKVLSEAEQTKEDVPDPVNNKDTVKNTSQEVDTSITNKKPAVEQNAPKPNTKVPSILLPIYKRQIQKELDALPKSKLTALPITKTLSIFKQHDILLVDVDGNNVTPNLKKYNKEKNITCEMIPLKTGTKFTNCKVFIQWSDNDDGTYEYNCYIS